MQSNQPPGVPPVAFCFYKRYPPRIGGGAMLIALVMAFSRLKAREAFFLLVIIFRFIKYLSRGVEMSLGILRTSSSICPTADYSSAGGFFEAEDASSAFALGGGPDDASLGRVVPSFIKPRLIASERFSGFWKNSRN